MVLGNDHISFTVRAELVGNTWEPHVCPNLSRCFVCFAAVGNSAARLVHCSMCSKAKIPLDCAHFITLCKTSSAWCSLLFRCISRFVPRVCCQQSDCVLASAMVQRVRIVLFTYVLLLPVFVHTQIKPIP